jgi:hypothetical protein
LKDSLDVVHDVLGQGSGEAVEDLACTRCLNQLEFLGKQSPGNYVKLPPRKPFFALPTTPKGEASVGFPVHLIHFQDKGQRHGIHDQIHLSQQVIPLMG